MSAEIKTFNFNNRDVTINLELRNNYSQWADNNVANAFLRHMFESVIPSSRDNVIGVRFFEQLVDTNGNLINGTSIPKSWTEGAINEHISWYDHFATYIHNQEPEKFQAKVSLNALFQRLKNYFGEGITLFSASNEYAFRRPIQLSLDNSIANQVTASVLSNPLLSHEYEYSLNGGDFSATAVFTDLPTGTHEVEVWDKTESTEVGFDVKKKKTVQVFAPAE